MKTRLYLAVLCLFTLGSSFSQAINEGFANVAGLTAAGWNQQNLSTPIGSNPNWVQGSSAVFPENSAPVDSYIASNFNAVAGAATISNWLFTPTLNLSNGASISFFTRSIGSIYPDNLQVRMSTNGSSTNVGATNTSVGDFSNLLLEVNPALTAAGYPSTWTQYTISVSGLAAPTSGRIAFRYYVPNGGPNGVNSDFIGIDDFVYTPVQPCNFTATASANNAMGGAPNGTVTLSVANGTAPYTYVWSSGQVTQNLSGLAPGTYSVTVTDAAGCTASASANVLNLAGPTVLPNSNVVSSYQVVNGGFTPQWVCPNQTLQTDGGIMKIYLESGATMITGGGIDTVYAKTGSTITMTGGIHVIYHEPGVTLNMNGGIPTLFPCSSLIFDYSLAPANGCAPMMNCNLSVALAVSNPIGGGNNGSINTTVSNGTFPFTYSWSGGQTSANLNNLSPGGYQVIVSDANGCLDTAAATLVNLAGPTVLPNSNVVSSYQVVNGGFTPQWVCQNDTLYTDGGIMKIYLESGATMITGGGIDTVYAKTGATIVMSGGIHVIYHEPGVNLVMNGGIPTLFPCPSLVFNYTQAPANGCVPVPVCNLSSTATTTNIDCHGAASGSATANVLGGAAPLTYVWSNGATTPTVSNLPAGTYTVTITDANGCTINQTVTITQASVLNPLTFSTNNLCAGENNGSIDLTVAGGTPPYTYSWSNGSTSEDISNLAAGVYTVTVNDGAGCTASTNVNITQPAAVSITTSSTDEMVGMDGTATATVSGGTPNYTYYWMPGGQTTASIGGLAAGIYTVVVLDANGCGDTLEVVVGSQVSLNETGLANALLYPNPSNGKVYLSFENGGVKEGVIEVYSMDGKRMLVQTLKDDSQYELSLKDWASGMYRVSIKSNLGTAVWSLVKQ
ncbi:MAG: choice-of-anchor J domain-containing protein [Bacteroidetes bacterium]|nr:choice-of-anchor J domain-containing protein [Bacteroidota bacterium]MBM3424397.1 T9SS type A sorting domain-containing protein [Bacteroidota bacterium]